MAKTYRTGNKRFVFTRSYCYNKCYQGDLAQGRGKEGLLMSYVMDKVHQIELPPKVRRELGLKKDWNKNFPVQKVEKIAKTAEKYKTALRELSKY